MDEVGPSIKGNQVIFAKGYLTEKFGPDAFDKVIEQLDPQSREILTRPILHVGWIPEECFVKFLISIDNLFGKGNYELCYQIGYYLGEISIPQFYRMFLKFGDPLFLVQRAPHLWKQLHNNGRLEVIKVNSHSVIARLIDKAYPHKAFCFYAMGFSKKGLELTGAKHVTIEEVKCVNSGAEFCEFSVSWQ